MKKKTFIMICLTVIFGMVLGPLQSVAAAEATWPSGIYPPPQQEVLQVLMVFLTESRQILV